jgi:hypothetical protein
MIEMIPERRRIAASEPRLKTSLRLIEGFTSDLFLKIDIY